jgi:hypothetical protein
LDNHCYIAPQPPLVKGSQKSICSKHL